MFLRIRGVVFGVVKPLSRAGEVMSGRTARLSAACGAVFGSWEGVAVLVAPVFGDGSALLSSGQPLPPLVAVLAGLKEGVVDREPC